MRINLDLLDNGLDYIMTGINHLQFESQSHSENIWKYSVLNVFSGIELILKEKLRQEHWSLVFEDVSNASEQKLLQGDFVSVSHNEVVKRLKGICNISINDEPINNLRKLRNRFEHFEIKVTVLECKQIIALAMRETILFWNKYLLSTCTEEQNQKFSYIQSIILSFDTYIESMLQKHNSLIETVLENNAGILVHCQDCHNRGFIIFKGEQKQCQCYVCDKKYSKQEYLDKIRSSERGRTERKSLRGAFMPYDNKCPNCKNQTRIRCDQIYNSAGEYEGVYYFCVDCLYSETEADIRSKEFEMELAELKKTLKPAEFTEMLNQRIKELKQELKDTNED